jgi:hypothetical protein
MVSGAAPPNALMVAKNLGVLWNRRACFRFAYEIGTRTCSMLRQNRKFFRNRLDLNDRVQVKVLRRRLRISEADLIAIADKVGNSIAGISKEIDLRRAKPIETPLEVLSSAVIDGNGG